MGSAEDAVKEKLLWNVKKEVRSGQGLRGSHPSLGWPSSREFVAPTRAAASPPGQAGAGSC